jgi:betaine-aldehyde dehydrogenase
MQRLAEEAQKIKIGHGLEDGVLLGPLVSQSQHEKVLSWIKTGKREARLVTGGGEPEGLEGGCYVEPTNSPTWMKAPRSGPRRSLVRWSA